MSNLVHSTNVLGQNHIFADQLYPPLLTQLREYRGSTAPLALPAVETHDNRRVALAKRKQRILHAASRLSGPFLRLAVAPRLQRAAVKAETAKGAGVRG